MKVKKGQLFIDCENKVWTLQEISKTFAFFGQKTKTEFLLESEEGMINIPSTLFKKDFKKVVCPDKVGIVVDLNKILELETDDYIETNSSNLE